MSARHKANAKLRSAKEMYDKVMESRREGFGHPTIDDLARQCHADNAKWYVDPKTGRKIKWNFGEKIALIHSELSEALEADRKDLMDDKLTHRKGVEVELADALIRILDLAGALMKRDPKFSLGSAFVEKRMFNATRPDHQLKNRLKRNGKKY